MFARFPESRRRDAGRLGEDPGVAYPRRRSSPRRVVAISIFAAPLLHRLTEFSPRCGAIPRVAGRADNRTSSSCRIGSGPANSIMPLIGSARATSASEFTMVALLLRTLIERRKRKNGACSQWCWPGLYVTHVERKTALHSNSQCEKGVELKKEPRSHCCWSVLYVTYVERKPRCTPTPMREGFELERPRSNAQRETD